MKKDKTGLLVLMLAATFALLFQSCKSEPPLPEPTTITITNAVTLSNDGSSDEIAIALSAPHAWSATTSADWCTITPASGVGSSKIVVTAKLNGERMARTAEIVVKAGKATSTVMIYQKDTMAVKTDNNIIITNDGGSIAIDIEANTVWEVIKADARAAWVDFTPNHGTGKGVVKLTIDPNSLLKSRTTEIIFSAGNATRVITILQQNIAQATSATDSLALIALYNATDGKGWSNAWNLELPISAWKGVTITEIDGQSRVTAIRLPARGLDGEIPLEIGNMTSLKTIDLSSNAIKGDLPDDIANLTQLEELNLANNKFTGAISINITKLVKLKTLDLQHNRFNEFPSAICGLTNLEYIHLADNELSSLPGEVGQMSNLKFLYLDNNQLSSLPTGLELTPKLEYLHAASNIIVGSLPEAIGSMANLVSLRLENNSFSGAIPANFANLAKLEYLYLSNNKLSGPLPDMSRMTKLQVLSGAGNALSGAIPDFGNNGLLTSLTRIELTGNKLKGELTENLRYLNSISEIYVSGNLLSGTLPVQALAGRTNNYPNSPSWESMLYLPKLKALAVNDNYLSGTIPAGLAYRLEQYNPAFNKSQFRLNGNNFTGTIPSEFKGAYGNMPEQFNFEQNLYPQRGGTLQW